MNSHLLRDFKLMKELGLVAPFVRLVLMLFFIVTATNIDCLAKAKNEDFALKGTILDAVTREPLSFATVSVQGTSKGVVSNFLGEFEIQISIQNSFDSLLISSMGYKPFKQVIRSLIDENNLQIQLEENTIILDEVIVSDEQMTAKEIMQKVIDNIPINYPTSPYLIDGFTRAHKKECGEYVSLFEATFDLFGKGYASNKKVGYPEKIYLKETRKSKYVEQYLSRALNAQRNPFVILNHMNDVLLKKSSMRISQNEYEIDKVTMLEDRVVYIIKGKSENPMMSNFNFKLFIDADNYAVLRLEDEFRLLDGQTNDLVCSDSTIQRVSLVAKTLQFKKQKNKYFLKYLNYAFEGDMLMKETKQPFCDVGNRFEMMLGEAITDQIVKPPKENLLLPKERKDPRLNPYNPSFWSDFSVIKDFPITEQIVTDLSKNIPLEKQFEQSYNEMRNNKKQKKL
ncbi:MAG: carboxypeptidase-like regulatory domain-containing protein [Reichenbachiella sp.]